MAGDVFSDSELEQLAEEWNSRFEAGLARTSLSVAELEELAMQQRSLANVSDSVGQRRALIALAERYEREAADRAAIRP